MAMLSELLRSQVVDSEGGRAPLSDLTIALLEEDHPPVTGIHYVHGSVLKRLDWAEVKTVDREHKRFVIDDLRKGEPVAGNERPDEVLLRRDVLDALIIDLLTRRTTRSCDLMLSNSDDELRLSAVDAGLGAMIRRITGGRFRGAKKEALYDWRYVEFLRGDPQAVDSGAGYRLRINRLPAGEIAQIGEYLPYLHAAELLTLLPNEKAARTLEAMTLERQLQIIEEFDDEEAVDVLSRMSPDRATDLLGRLRLATMKRFLGMMDKTKRERIIHLLRYPEDSVGGVMINNITCMSSRSSAGPARTQLAKHARAADFILMIFVTESSEDATLKGTLTIRELMLAKEDATLEDIMDPYAATLNAFDPAADAAYRIIGSQVAAMPVTTAEGRLIGAMTIDSAIGHTVPVASGLRGIKVFS